MNEKQRQACKTMRKMADEEAAGWLKENYPSDDVQFFWDAIFLLPHRPWKKKQRDELLDYYLSYLKVYHVPSSAAFEPLALLMPIYRLCEIMIRHLPVSEKHLDLLAYNGIPVLRNSCKTEKDHQAVDDLERRINDRMGRSG